MNLAKFFKKGKKKDRKQRYLSCHIEKKKKGKCEGSSTTHKTKHVRGILCCFYLFFYIFYFCIVKKHKQFCKGIKKKLCVLNY